MSLRSRRILVLIAVVAFLVLLLWRPGANRFRARLEKSITLALGRQVEIGGVSLQFLPRPGFELSRFTVRDDPRFGAEPILRADEVTAVLHPSSLWRWRVEIARLSFKEPSLNLVRLQDGHWNLEAIVERATHAQAAPTGRAGSEARPRFPYVEADAGRINIKLGMEKKAYALTDADFALWLQSEGEWGMRLKARPVRTDMALSDTGTLRVNGSWKRSSAGDTPVAFTLSLQDAQLGQLTKLITGSDLGWRGGVNVSANLSGSVAEPEVQVSSSVDDFRRYDIFSGRSQTLDAHCAARYVRARQELSEIQCQPSGNAPTMEFSGHAHLAPPWSYELQLSTSKLPMQSVLELMRRAKKAVPDDLSSAGVIDADMTFSRDDTGSVRWSGGGEATGVALQSSVLGDKLELGTIPLRLTPGDVVPRSNPHVKSVPAPSLSIPAYALEVGTFTVPLGRKPEAILRAWFSSAGYGFSFSGGGPLQRVLKLAKVAAIPIAQPAVEGDAVFDLRANGTWSGFSPPLVLGTMQVEDLRTEVQGVNAPLVITSATIVLNADATRVDKLSATLDGMHWSGSVSRPRQCPGGTCLVQIDLHVDELSTDKLNRLLNPNLRKQPWYRLLTGTSQTGGSALARLSILGSLLADRLQVRDLTFTHAATVVDLNEARLKLSRVRADLMGGKVTGEWHADFKQLPPRYEGSGKLEGISLAQLGKLMREDWITGSANGEYQLKFSGWSVPEMRASAAGNLAFDASGGALARFSLAGHSPVHFRRLRGKLELANAAFTVKEGKLESPDGIYAIAGTASFGRDLRLTLLPSAGQGFSVTGNLATPRSKPLAVPEEQALKAR